MCGLCGHDVTVKSREGSTLIPTVPPRRLRASQVSECTCHAARRQGRLPGSASTSSLEYKLFDSVTRRALHVRWSLTPSVERDAWDSAMMFMLSVPKMTLLVIQEQAESWLTLYGGSCVIQLVSALLTRIGTGRRARALSKGFTAESSRVSRQQRIYNSMRAYLLSLEFCSSVQVGAGMSGCL